MTEKRFWLVSLEYDGEQRFVRDNNQIGEKSLSNKEVVDLLNEQHEQLEIVKLLADHRGEIIAFANSLIQDLGGETEKEMWETFKGEMYQKWKKERRIE